ncbi:MAG: transcription elongation factor subunit Spt4 [Desulfurococcaceae archaeon]|uniref:Transcription elongation factor Spt4 n=1 Tax=Staphylothermus marinus TaxID=2280 RepID=A0A7C4D800_STAMA
MSSRGRGKVFKACRSCKALVDREVAECPICGSRDFSEEWEGIIIIIDPEKSRIAKILGIVKPGKYAVKVA